MSAVEAMRQERDDLKERAGKLKDFICTPRFKKLSKEDQTLLNRQLGVMTELTIILGQRIVRVAG